MIASLRHASLGCIKRQLGKSVRTSGAASGNHFVYFDVIFGSDFDPFAFDPSSRQIGIATRRSHFVTGSNFAVGEFDFIRDDNRVFRANPIVGRGVFDRRDPRDTFGINILTSAPCGHFEEKPRQDDEHDRRTGQVVQEAPRVFRVWCKWCIGPRSPCSRARRRR